jgi:hypothetical protein
MSGTTTTRLLRPYVERIQRPRFMTTFFQTPPENFHNSDTVEIDIIRQGQDIALPVPDPKAGARRMELKVSVNKAWEPITYKYETSINAAELTRRLPGQIPYDDPSFMAAALELAYRGLSRLETMMRDATELHCTDVLQNGTLYPKDENNNTVGDGYDFQPLDGTGTIVSGDLMVTVAVDWHAEGSAGVPLSDMQGLAANMRARGYNPTDAIFGTTAWDRFIINSTVLAKYDKLHILPGMLEQGPQRDGATRQGTMTIGDYAFKLWTYGGTYKNAYTGNMTPYLTADHVVLIDANARRDLTFGSIARFPQARDVQALSVLPSRIALPESGFDVSPYAYFTPDLQNLVICAGTRVLPIPTAIDSFARMNVIA